MIRSTRPAECDTLRDQEPLRQFRRNEVVLRSVFDDALNFIRSLRSQKIRTPTPSVNENKRKSNEPTTSGRSVTERTAAVAILPRRCIDSSLDPTTRPRTNKDIEPNRSAGNVCIEGTAFARFARPILQGSNAPKSVRQCVVTHSLMGRVPLALPVL